MCYNETGDGMKKRGFTLVEMLAVLVLIAIISLIVFPSIINYINSTKGDISAATKELIIGNAKLYVSDNETTFPLNEGYSYCTTLRVLADKNYLDTPFVDSTTGKEVDLDNTYVKVSYVYDYDLGINNYTYDVSDSCTSGIADGYTLATTDGSVVNLDNKEVVDYKIYGNSAGINTLNIKTLGKNLLSTDDWYNFYKKNLVITDATLTNGGTNDGYSVITWTPTAGYDDVNETVILYPMFLKPDTQYTLKYKCKMATSNTRSPGEASTGISFYYTDGSKVDLCCDDSTEWQDKVFTSDANKQVKALYMPYIYGYEVIVAKDSVVLSEGTDVTYEPYKDMIKELSFSSSLKSDEYIDYKSKSVIRNDGTSEQIELPKIETYDGISNIFVSDENDLYSSKVELLVRNKNKA